MDILIIIKLNIVKLAILHVERVKILLHVCHVITLITEFIMLILNYANAQVDIIKIQLF
jgi:hypothetical protein